MIAFTAIWLLLGLIAILVLLTLAIKKKFKWNFFGLTLAIYLLLSFIFLVVAGSPSSTNSAKESNQSSQQSTVRIFKLIYSDDDDYNGEIHFDSNKDGKYTVKIKGLQNGKVKLKNADDSQEKFKTQTFTIKKGQTLKIPITLKSDDLVHNFKLEDSNDNSKKFSIYNDSDSANSIMNSMSASESSESENDKTNSNFEKASKFESQLNTAIEKSNGAISDIKCDINPTTGKINSVTFIVDDSVAYADNNDIQKIRDKADYAVSSIATQNHIKHVPDTHIQTESGQTLK
jgi:hypothetical protein